MKKNVASILAAVMLLTCFCCTAFAEDSVYTLLSELMNGREFTLTVSAEDVDGLEDILAPYGTAVCSVKQENDEIVLSVTCDSDTYLTASATAQGVHLETNFIDMEPVTCDWETLMPNITVTDDGAKTIKIGMTGPDRELINFSFKVKGESLTDYQAEVYIGFITGPGAVYSLWDSFGATDGSSSHDFAFTWSESELLLEGTGTETSADGVVTRDDEITVCLNEEEIGTVNAHSELVIQ